MSVRNLFSHRTICYIAFSSRKINASNIKARLCLSPWLSASPETYGYFSVLGNTKYRNPFLLCHRFVHSCQETITFDNVTKPCFGNLVEESAAADEFSPQFSSTMSERSFGNLVEESAAANEFFPQFSSTMSERIFEVYREWYMDNIDYSLEHIMREVERDLMKGGHEQIISSVMANPSQDLHDDVWRTLQEVSSVALEKYVEGHYFFVLTRLLGIEGAVRINLNFETALERFPEKEFYMELELIREKIRAQVEKGESEAQSRGASENNYVEGNEGAHVISSCKRSGNMNLKIYLDLSYSFLGRVADKIHETVDVVWKVYNQISKVVSERKLLMHEDSNLSPVSAKWVTLLQPGWVNWNALLDRLKRQSSSWYFEISEPVQEEEYYETAIREYLMLVDTYLKQNRLEDAKRILKKMTKKGIKQTEDICITLLRSFAQHGDADGANKIAILMESDGFQPSLESCSLLVEVYCRAGDPHAARRHFDHIARLGGKPGLNPITNMLVAYEKKELYNDAFDFLMQLEKDGLEHGFSSYLEDAFDRMELVNETEQLLGDIDQLLQKIGKV